MSNNTLNQRDLIMLTADSTVKLVKDSFPSDRGRFRHLHIGVSGGPIRWLAVSDKSPSASYGSFVGAGGSIDWTNPEIDYSGMIQNLRVTKAGASDASLEIALFW